MKAGNTVHGFRIDRIRDIPDAAGTLYEMTHEKTGAQLCWLKRDDRNKTFAVTFKTTPENDTGVFHILEHSVLNGSQKYPVREPFVELLKGSMQTYLNAMTFPDKTMYPVASRNEKDFMNLLSVYMDAVFRPAIYTNPNIFYQEGWHYEIRDEKEEPVYKGVVLNEMKGAFSSVDETIVDEFGRMLFPDNCYRFVSGGDPEYITDLSYEEFIRTHQKYYHPTNARFFVDGDPDIDEVLAFINDEYLSHYEREDVDFSIPMQVPGTPEHHRYTYEIEAGEDPADKTQIAFGRIISTFDDAVKNNAWGLLSGLLVASNESQLKKAIIDNGLGQDLELDLIDGIQQPWLVMNVRNTNEENYEKIRTVLRETALKMTEEGLNHDQIIAALNQAEFRYREKHEPAGIMYAGRAMTSWLYDGDPAQYLLLGDIFDVLRKKTEEGYFEDLLREFMLEEDKLFSLIAVPDNTLGEQKAQREREKLAAAKQSWGDETALHIERNRILDEWQASEDSEEAYATLPKLSLEDLEKKPEEYHWEETAVRGVPVIVHPAEESGIVYLNLYFNLAGITREHLPDAGFWTVLPTNLPTEDHTVEELQSLIRRDLGGLSFYLDSYSVNHEYEACVPVMGVTCSVLEKNLDRAVDLMLEIMQKTVYDKEKILPLLRQENEDFRQELIMNGSSFAVRRVAAHNSSEGVFREYVGGYEASKWTKELEENYEERADDFVNECEMLSDIIFSSSRLTLSITGDHPETVENLISRLHHIDANRAKVHYPLLDEAKEAIVIPAGIGYAAVGSNFQRNGLTYNTGLQVISQALTYGYLWNEVRVKGGAYGTGFSINANGNCAAYSYRDPDPLNTLNVTKQIGEFVRTLPDETDTEQLIIGTLAGADPLLSPAGKVRLKDGLYFREATYEKRCKGREIIMAMTAEKIREYADAFEQAMQKGAVCVIGPKEAVDGLPEFTQI